MWVFAQPPCHFRSYAQWTSITFCVTHRLQHNIETRAEMLPWSCPGTTSPIQNEVKKKEILIEFSRHCLYTHKFSFHSFSRSHISFWRFPHKQKVFCFQIWSETKQKNISQRKSRRINRLKTPNLKSKVNPQVSPLTGVFWRWRHGWMSLSLENHVSLCNNSVSHRVTLLHKH